MSCAQCVTVLTGYTTDASPSLKFPIQCWAFGRAVIPPSLVILGLFSLGPSVSFSPFYLLSASAAAVPSSSFTGPFLPDHMVFILAAKDINFIIHEKSHSN